MDATEILAKFQNYDFGAVEIDQLHLSQRRAARDAILYATFFSNKYFWFEIEPPHRTTVYYSQSNFPHPRSDTSAS